MSPDQKELCTQLDRLEKQFITLLQSVEFLPGVDKNALGVANYHFGIAVGNVQAAAGMVVSE